MLSICLQGTLSYNKQIKTIHAFNNSENDKIREALRMKPVDISCTKDY